MTMIATMVIIMMVAAGFDAMMSIMMPLVELAMMTMAIDSKDDVDDDGKLR